jgi:hypothetical protein
MEGGIAGAMMARLRKARQQVDNARGIAMDNPPPCGYYALLRASERVRH